MTGFDPPPHDAQAAAIITSATAVRHARPRKALAFHRRAKTKRMSIPVTLISQSSTGDGVKRGQVSNIPAGRAVVVNVTVADFAFDPSIVTDCGETEHVDALGAPVQVQATV